MVGLDSTPIIRVPQRDTWRPEIGGQEPAEPPVRAGRQDRSAEIQALRAVAVSLVVVFHLWPKALTGGYIGVDVFFVISGYLITTQLTREAMTTGALSIGRFYARRVMRLLAHRGPHLTGRVACPHVHPVQTMHRTGGNNRDPHQ